MPNRYFADLSNNNRRFDPHAYAEAGHLLVMLKASEGVGFMDPLYRKRRHMAHAAGLFVVHYHFARPDNHGNDGREEARAFAAAIHGGVGRYDALVIDVERGTKTQASPRYLLTFEEELDRFYPHYPLILYRSKANFTNLHPKSGRTIIAAYDGTKMSLTHGVDPWAHQFTDGKIGATPHICAGIGNCDINRLNATSYRRFVKLSRA